MSFFHGFSDELMKRAADETLPWEYSTKGGAIGGSLGAIIGAILGAGVKGARLSHGALGAGLGGLFGLGAGQSLGAVGDVASLPGHIVDRWKEL